MQGEFKRFAEEGLRKAHSLGVQAAEIYVMKNSDLDLQVKNGAVEETKVAASQGIGVRVIKDNRLGFSFSSDFAPQSLDKMLRQAVINARYNDSDAFLALPERAEAYPQLAIYDDALPQVTLEEKIAMASAAEQAALSADKRVARVERAGFEDGETEIWIANSNGVFGHTKGNYCGVYCLALGGEGGGTESGYGMDVNIYYDQLSAEKAGAMAAERAVQLLGAGGIKTQRADLIFAPQVGIQIMGIIAAGFSGDAVLKGRSLFNGQLGEQIASPLVTIIDDGTLAGGLGSIPFDGEGVPCRRNVLVENGRLQMYLYNTRAAKEAGVQSTGNGLRGSFKGIPSIGVTNYFVAAGQETVEALMGRVEKGLYVTEILGAHTANAITGDFSFGASGIWLENGRKIKPVRGATIAGNFKDLLQKIDGVADDLTFYGSSGAPTMKVAQMMISGE